MKIGLKTWEDSAELAEQVRLASPDFLEIMSIEGKDHSSFLDYGIPTIIHCEHNGFGVNPADPAIKERNKKAVDFASKTADLLGAKMIVIHPGVFMNQACSVSNSIDFLKTIKDERFIIENMPYYLSPKKEIIDLGKSPDEIKEILKATSKQFCFDFGHCAASAFGMGLDFMDTAKKFMELKPVYFHLSDNLLNQPIDGHMHLGNGEMDLKAIVKLIPKNALVLLETPTNVEGRVQDVEFIRKLSSTTLA